MNTRFSDHEFSLNTLITIFFAYFDISTELATDSFFRMHGDRNNFYLIAFIFFEYQQKVRKIKYNQPDFFIKGYDPFHYSTLSPRNNHIFHEQKRYKWSDTIYTRYQLYFSLFSCWAKPLELLSCNLVKKKISRNLVKIQNMMEFTLALEFTFSSQQCQFFVNLLQLFHLSENLLIKRLLIPTIL